MSQVDSAHFYDVMQKRNLDKCIFGQLFWQKPKLARIHIIFGGKRNTFKMALEDRRL